MMPRERTERLHIGCHLSSAKGFLHMGEEAHAIGADTFAFFTRNPRGGNAKPLDAVDAEALRDYMKRHHFAPIVAHAPYTLNLCSDREEIRDFARRTMADDLRRMLYLPGNYYNFHPGSHVKQGAETGIRLIAESLRELLSVLPEGGARPPVTILLETMAGKGSEVGRSFEEIAEILDRAGADSRLGVCLDTCHVYDAGYDIAGDLDGVLREFDMVIGIGRLKALHVNDSRNPMGSRKDRHEKIGEGSLGLETFISIVRHPLLRHLPMILETPNELDGYRKEIQLLRECAGEEAEGAERSGF